MRSRLALITAVALMSSSFNQTKFDDDYEEEPKTEKKPEEPKNKYNFSPEELETYRNLGKRERKEFLKSRG